MKLRTVFFDFGRTLFDIREPGELVARSAAALGLRADPVEALRIWEEIAEAALAPAELDRKRDLSARAHRENWIRLLAPLDRLGPGLARAVYDAQKDVENWEPYADVRAVLRRLRAAGVSAIVVSDTGFDLRPIVSHHLDGERLIDDFVLSFEHGAVKPDPVLFQAALDAAGVRAADTLMVGDNPATDGGSFAVGIPALILPPARRGGPRGLDAVLRLAGA